jgi:hypothetical protein
MIPRTGADAARPAILCALAVASFLAAPAPAQDSGYSLSPGSEYRTGCFAPPCTCAPIQLAMTGSMALVRTAPTPKFANYDVVGVHWVVQFPEDLVDITGSGTYRVGGTGTLQQQLVLDLSVGGGPIRHFDSGLVPGGADFPRLNVDVSLRGQTPCIDTLLRVRAGPTGTADVGPVSLILQPLVPNPFRSGTRLAFTVREAGSVRLSVHDAAGRCVRTLVDGDRLEAGAHAVVWDGCASDGRACAAGRYFVRVRAGGRTERVSVVRLK